MINIKHGVLKIETDRAMISNLDITPQLYKLKVERQDHAEGETLHLYHWADKNNACGIREGEYAHDRGR